MTMVAHIDLEAGRDPVVSLTPCMINSKGQPTPVLPSDEAGFGRFVAYMKRANWLGGVHAHMEAQGSRIAVRSASGT